MASILHFLKERSLRTPDRQVFTFLENGELPSASLTFAALEMQARGLAAGILKIAAKGDRVLLLLPQGIDFIVAFYACMKAGVISVPCSIPTKRERLKRTQSIIDDAQPTLVLYAGQLPGNEKYEDVFSNRQGCSWLTIDQLDAGELLPGDFPLPEGSDIAYLQYTSGSTGAPKGTIILHENITDNLASFQEAFQHDHDTVCVSWLPFFHDMGLVYGLMQPVFSGYHCLIMAPLAFMQNPVCWLRAISDYKATHTVAPNFGYELCASLPESQKEGLDLSSWKVAINGSEFIRWATLKKFTEAYKAYGWQENTFCPGYGMAEATLMVTALAKGLAPCVLEFEAVKSAEAVPGIENHKYVVGCGYLNAFTEVRIVQPGANRLCKDGAVGEIWLAGKNIAPGYWNNEAATEATFHARLEGSEQHYLRTGDLGFVHDNQLFIVGRIKELIIINGQNFYPTDLEQLAESCDPALKENGVCAFSYTADDQEKVAIVCEIKRTAVKNLNVRDIVKKIRARLVEEFGVRVAAVCLLNPLTLPRTTSGKIQRLGCKSLFLEKGLSILHEWEEKTTASEPGAAKRDLAAAEKEQLRQWLIRQVAETCAVDASEIETGEPLSFYGMDSNLATRLAQRLEAHWGRPVSPTIFYNYPTIDALVEESIDLSASTRTKRPDSKPETAESIAIIGMGCRFPGAADVEEFWQLLETGGCAIGQYPESRWAQANSDLSKEHPSVNFGGMLTDIDQFDPAFFGITPREASYMDPQQRLLLEVTWEALQDAGIRPSSLQKTRTGVYVGISANEYAGYSVNEAASAHAVTGIALSIAASRISYLLDLKGPALAIDTACSSSLVALHRAVKDLQAGDVDMAIVGGVNLLLNPIVSVIFDKAGMLSPEGRCKTFDAGANGYVRSEGCGMIVLKRKSEALNDGNSVWAVIRGAATNQDGKSNGITAPNGRSQVEVIRQALQTAQVDARDISFFEAHGTGTPLGDPIEAGALQEVLGHSNATGGNCWLSSVKANVGHLEAAAGIAGLIKATLCLHKKMVPPQVNFNRLNPEIKLGQHTPLNITRDITRLDAQKTLYAGVSSFGFGGTNAHVILESYTPDPIETTDTGGDALFLLSAATEASLTELVRRHQKCLDRYEQTSLARLSHSMLFDRELSKYTLGVVAHDWPSLRQALTAHADLPGDQAFRVNRDARSGKRMAWVFTGQGSQYAEMGKSLYDTEPVFKAALDACSELLLGISFDLPGVLADELNTGAINETQYAQPAIFSIEYALAKLLLSWGLKPDVLIGHSIGEYAAACISGILSLEDALTMLCLRGKLMQEMPAGKMTAVFANESRLEPVLDAVRDQAGIAVYNTTDNVVVSGEAGALEQVHQFCRDNNLSFKPLVVSHAFHSPMMGPIQQAFEKGIQQVRFGVAGIPIISTMTGLEIGLEMATATYWTRHIRKPVVFRESIRLAAQDCGLFLEIGPRAQLQGVMLENAPEAVIYPAITGKGQDRRDLLLLAGKLHAHKIAVNWEAIVGKRLSGESVKLPFQPYDKAAYWIYPPAQTENLAAPVRIEMPATSAPVASVPAFDIETLAGVVSQVLHIPADRLDAHASLTSLGADSIMLLELIKKIKSRFQVELSIRQLFGELSSLNALGNYLAEQSPKSVTPFLPPALPNAPAETGAPVAAPLHNTADNGLASLFQKQLDLVNQTLQKQFELLGAGSAHTPSSPVQSTPVNLPADQLDPKLSVTYPKLSEERTLTPRQQAFFNDLLNRYTKKTKGSKEHAIQARQQHADWLYSIDFRLATKEFLYPIVARNAQDARLTDIDGNEYIDLAIGYGVNFFGNSPGFVKAAIAAQLEAGQEIAAQHLLAAETARKICALTNQERLTFVNSGTEAVMVAIRIARTVNRRNKIAIFNGYYHGTFDGNLAQTDPDSDGAMPSSTGIPRSLIHDVILLNYGQESSFAKIREHAHEIAAVLIEPVQSRKPEGFDQAFLQQLRDITASHNIALIFDEIITGFRVHAGGMRAITGIKADLTTYGKVIGGGMPIGLVAGSARYMDAIDGGSWNYGDQSHPMATKTFFGGTFCKHPLTLAAINAAADYLLHEGPALHERVNALAAKLQEELNAFFRETGVPMKIVRYGSLFRFVSEGAYNMLFRPIEMDLFFYSLMEKGIFTWERRICFLSVTHTEADIKTIISKVKETIYDLLEGGFFPEANYPVGSEKFPLSTVQQQLYLLSSLNEGASVACQMRMTLKCSGKLEVALLEKAIQTLLQRHEALRIKFAPHGEYQEIVSPKAFPLEVTELPAGTADTEVRLHQWLNDEAHVVLDLHNGPLFRIRLLKTSANVAYLSMTAHHLVADGWSMGVIAKDLGDIYSNLLHPGSRVLSEPLAFSAYLQRQNSAAQVSLIQNQKPYWQHKLDGASPTRLPFGNSRTQHSGHSGSRIRKRLPATLLAPLKALSNEQGCTLFMSLYAAFSALLHKLSGNPALFIGVPAAGRSFETDQFMVGSCADTLVLSHAANAIQPFSQYLQQVKAVLTEAYEHQDCLFSYVKDDLQLRGSNNLRVVFNLDTHVQLPEFAGLETELAYSPIRYAQFDLLFDLSVIGESLQVECDYNAGLFDEATMQRFIGWFERVLEAVIRQPAVLLADLPIIDDQECIVLQEFNKTELLVNPPLPLPALFAQQALQTPDHIALACGDQQLTYSELNKLSNQLAHHLIESVGLQKGAVVAVLESNSIEQLTALLAIAKAGGIWVSIDPGYDAATIQKMLRSSGAECVLLHSQRASRLQTGGIKSVVLDQQLHPLSTPGHQPEMICSMEDTACLVFSSQNQQLFSISHAGLAHAAMEQALQTGLTAADALLPLLSVSDGNFAADSFSALLAGAALHVVPGNFDLNSAGLSEYLEQHRITVVSTTPSCLSLLSDLPLTSVRGLISSGEALSLHDARHFTSLRNKSLFNKYGSPESAFYATIHQVTADDVAQNIVPIGRPSAHQAIFVLDGSGSLQPVGVYGEIAVGCNGHEPAFNLRNTLAHPFLSGENVCLTGDVAKWLPDGRLVFAGKKSGMLRSGEQAFNLFEIREQLLAHPHIAQAHVALDANGNLLAFVKAGSVVNANGAGPLSPEALKIYLKKNLPGYVAPKEILLLEHWPLTVDLKLDETQLPSVVASVSGRENLADTILSATESALLDIWKEVLETAHIGPDENYFDIGGQSLKGMQAGFRIRDHFDLQVTLREFIEFPTIRMMAAWIDRTLAATAAQPEAPAAAHHYYPVSLTQKRLWTLIQIEGAHHTYNLFGAFSVEGALNRHALEQAIGALVQRHEILRTTFEWREDELVQHIHPFESYVPEIAGQEFSGAQADQQIADTLRREEMHCFDLENGPLFRVGLIRLTEQKHILYLNLHHIIADGWSLEIIKRELNQLYTAYDSGRGIAPAPLALQYRDYAQKQLELLRSGALAGHRQYWTDRFKDIPPRLNLPIDVVARPSAKTYRGDREIRRLSTDVASAVYALAKAKQCTPFMVLISGVSALLNRYTRNAEMVLGASVLGRNEKDLENQVGFYINLLALRLEVNDQQGFEALLHGAKTTLLDALAHQSYPFDMLADDLEIERDLSFAPLFDVYVSINDKRDTGFELNNLHAEPYPTEISTSKYDLSFNFDEHGGGIELEIEYDTSLFTREKIALLHEHFDRLLACCLADVAAPLHAHDYLSAAEKQTLLHTFHGIKTKVAADISLPALFEKTALENAEKTAVTDGDLQLSYAAFDACTNQFAHYLMSAHGVIPGDRVLVMAAPGHQMVIALFSILKAGAVYVPIDPSYPADRIAQICEACTPRAILTDVPSYEGLQNLTSVSIPDHKNRASLQSYSPEKLPVTVSGDDLAYIIYTSGSTGTPKGVMIRHKSVYNTIHWMWEALHFDQTDVVLQKTSFTFDVSVWEFFLTLCFGARLVCCPKELSYDMEGLHRYIDEQGVTSLSFVPSALVVYQDYLSRRKEPIRSPLKRIIAAGEALKPQTVKTHYQQFSCPLLNLYGPTEATIYVSYYETTPQDEVIPIGRPLYNTSLLVLDDYRQLCPVGVPGEIAIGGIGLAEGYYRNAELTNKAFVDHPYRAGEKLYLTGDVGKMRKDGNLVYLGRKDHQIKLRGFRIELGEIETVLSQHEQVNEAVVMLKEGAAPFLVAYVATPHAPAPGTLKTWLNSKLPSYMVPSAFIFMEAFPVNSNGKIDRKALLKTESSRVSNTENSGNGKTSNGAFTTTGQKEAAKDLPANPIELQMLRIWEKVLQPRMDDIRNLQAAVQSNAPQVRISVTDNFFKIGGDSYLAVKLSAMLKKELRLPIEVRNIFDYPTIRALCEFAGGQAFEYTPIPVQESRPYYAAAPAQRRFFLMQELSADKARYNLYASLWLDGPLNADVLKQAVAELVARHESLRTSFLDVDGDVKQVIHAADVLPAAFHFEDFSDSASAEKQVLEEIRQSGLYTFDLAIAPLLHLRLLKVSDTRHALAVNIHHIICDEWSLEVLVGELKALYQSLLAGLASPLKPLASQYKDFVVWQEQTLQAERKKLRAYWLGLFANGVPQLNLPLDFRRPANRSSEGMEFRNRLSAERLASISPILEQEDATFNQFFTAAVTFFLHKITGQHDIVMGTPVSGRIHPDTEQQIGLFINTLTLYNRVDEEAPFSSLLQTVKQQSLEAQDHQLYPFDALVNDVLEDREEGRNPLFDVWMVYHNAEVSERGFDRLSEEVAMSPIEDGVVLSRYDLKFDFIKTASVVDILFECSNDLFAPETSRRLHQAFMDSLNYFIDHFQEKPSSFEVDFSAVAADASEVADPAPVKKIGKRARKS